MQRLLPVLVLAACGWVWNAAPAEAADKSRPTPFVTTDLGAAGAVVATPASWNYGYRPGYYYRPYYNYHRSYYNRPYYYRGYGNYYRPYYGGYYRGYYGPGIRFGIGF